MGLCIRCAAGTCCLIGGEMKSYLWKPNDPANPDDTLANCTQEQLDELVRIKDTFQGITNGCDMLRVVMGQTGCLIHLFLGKSAKPKRCQDLYDTTPPPCPCPERT